MEDILVPIGFTLLGIVWISFHYITKWKTAPSLTINDEALLEDLYQLARRLDDRMETVERLIAADNPDFRPTRALADATDTLDDFSEIDARAPVATRRR